MVPPQAPKWVDLGLPSGTLWLDRLVGAQAPNAFGLFYQWGDVNGHSVQEHYTFNQNEYISKGLDMITTDLDIAHDAARAFYGNHAKMPSKAQLQELIENCSFSFLPNSLLIITSKVNGQSIKLRNYGYFGTDDQGIEKHFIADHLIVWSSIIRNNRFAEVLTASTSSKALDGLTRWDGANVMAVHS